VVLYDENRFLIRGGGLMFDGTDDEDSFDRVAALVGRNHNSKPKNLPVEGPRFFKVVINTKTIKGPRLGNISLPASPRRRGEVQWRWHSC
jgi:hypothetical protein